MTRSREDRQRAAAVIRKRKLDQQNEARYGKSNDLSWQRFTTCIFCGRRICVNNNPTRTPKVPPRQIVDGVWMCPWCLGLNNSADRKRAEFMVAAYKYLLEQEDKRAWKILRKKLAALPKRYQK